MMEHYYQKTLGEGPDGWFTYPELYRDIVKDLPANSTFVEVGAWKGKSIVFFAVEAINSGKNIKVFAVDTWVGSDNEPGHHADEWVAQNKLYELFLSNIARVNHVVTPIRQKSLDAVNQFADKSLDAVFIDAEHSYEAVLADIKAWYPKVKPGGLICGHDYLLPSVNKAVKESFPEPTIGFRNAWENCWIVKVPQSKVF